MKKGIVVGLFVLAIIAIAASLSGLLVMVVWNLLAGFFGFKTIPFWVGVIISLALSIVGNAFRSSK